MNNNTRPLKPVILREVAIIREAAFFRVLYQNKKQRSFCPSYDCHQSNASHQSRHSYLYHRPSARFSGFLILLLAISPVTVSYAIGEEIVAADAILKESGLDSQPKVTEATTGPSDSTTTNAAAIETKPAPQKDADIRARITGIFSEIEGLQTVTVRVNKGVVTLGGEVPNEKKAQQAINLANRLNDVVTVDDNISRTLDVQDNVSTVYNSLKAQFKTFLKAAPLLLIALVIFGLVAWFGAWLSRREALWQRLTPNPFVAELLAQSIKVIFIILGLILGLSLVGAEAIIGTLLGGAGVIGIAVGFAVKDTIENYIASLMLSVRQPFRARDQVDINGREGIVVRLTSRATILMTLDGNQLRIPNSEVFKGTILNYTKNPERRFTFKLGVDANDDPLAAIKVGIDAIRALDFVLEQPKSIAVIDSVGDSNIILQFQVWVDQSKTDFAKARSIAIRETKHALENHGFSLPEPIYRLRFDPALEAVMKQGKAQETQAITPSLPFSPSISSMPSPTHHNIEPKSDDKERAKERAKRILQGVAAADILDAQPDNKLMEKVNEEIAEGKENTDLLDQNSPQE
ncbi:MAG: mechanosensitive ion channel [Psychrobacter sp.]|nr:mechanosensitive ion channel [Psychrobacter sp.]